MYYILAMDYEGDYEIIDYAFDITEAQKIKESQPFGYKVLKDKYLKAFMDVNTITNVNEWKSFIK